MMLDIGENAFGDVVQMRGIVCALEAIADMVGKLLMEVEVLQGYWSAEKSCGIWDISWLWVGFDFGFGFFCVVYCFGCPYDYLYNVLNVVNYD